ncbi:MAG: dephospho-CoA kinase [Hydrogenophaga sp.]
MTAHGPLRLGLTGGIGSGKSTVAALLQAHGATVIDADAIARACTLPGGAAMPAIAVTFGAAFVAPDGGLDRNRMRAHVFAQPDARTRLEEIVHPLVGQAIARQADAVQGTATCVVFDIPLLVESPRWRPQLDRILVIDCSRETQIRRVMARNGWPRSTVESVLDSQCPRQHRLAAADIVLFNDAEDLQQLRNEVLRLVQRFGL